MGSSGSRSLGATRESSVVASSVTASHNEGHLNHAVAAISGSVDQIDFVGQTSGALVQGQAIANPITLEEDLIGQKHQTQVSHTTSWDRNCSISASRSFSNFSQSRHKLDQSDSLSSENLLATHSKTYWPVATIDRTFLPHFPLAGRAFRDRFTVQRLLERGAFGVVYEVSDDRGDRFALKTLSKSQIILGGALGQVRNEVDIQTICGHHPFVVQCHAFWQTHRKICILTEFVSGGELFARIKDFTFALVRLYVLEIAIAIDFLHNAGIIYRDLKPENILLDRDCHVKLVDFGLSKWLKIGQRTNTICGTPQYMAPEVLAERPYGHAVDWWALGVVACRMLTQNYPDLRYPANSDEPDNRPLTQRPIGIVCVLPDDPEHARSRSPPIEKSSRDLLLRLLEPDPQKRLRSLFSLERIAFYKDYSFADVRHKKISPLELIAESERDRDDD